MNDGQNEAFKSSVIDSLVVGSIGKLLVRKGILSREELIAEMSKAREIFENSEDTAATRLVDEAIDSAVRAVEHW